MKRFTKEKIKLNLPVLIFFVSLLFTGLLWNLYFNSSDPIDNIYTSTLVLIMGSLFSVSAGMLARMVVSRGEYLEIEVEKRTAELQKANAEIGEKNIALEKAYRELKKVEELKSEFIAAVSHEFRTPLNSIKESMALILDKVVDPDTEKGREVLDIGKNSVDRLAFMINDLLDFSRLEAGKLSIEKEICSLRDIIEEAVVSLEPLAKKKNISLGSLKPGDVSGGVCVDRNRIIQVLTNLIDNAIKFTPPGGEVKVILQKAEHGCLKVIVEDNGIGIHEEDLERIFNKFEQVRGLDVKDKIKGSGLGLAICKGIMKLHGGKIWAESEPGKGSRFIVLLPEYNPSMIKQQT